VSAITANTSRTKPSGTCAWNRSDIELTKIILGVRHFRGMFSAAGCTVVRAREADGGGIRRAIAAAREIAARLGTDRNDYNTEFGPTNVELHAVSTAVDLGDAGEAIDLARAIDATGLSPERQSRMFIDLARAHAQRRHAGEAVAALLEAERLAPEQVQASTRVRDLVRDLLNLTGRRAAPDLFEFAHRIGAMT
jgi:hypothetical protein